MTLIPLPSQQAHIVAIDHEPLLRDLYCDVLQDAGYHVSVFSYAEKSVAAIAALAPDLLIMDFLWFDPADGWSFLDEVRAHPATKTLPVLLCTTAMPDVMASAGGMTGPSMQVVRKPFRLTELLDAVGRVVPRPASPWYPDGFLPSSGSVACG